MLYAARHGGGTRCRGTVSVHRLEKLQSNPNEGGFMMNQTDGWMGGWMGGGMWVWTVIGIAVVVLLVVAINNLSKK